MENETRFSGKTALITGGASGMGLLCGKCFAREGANVVLADINGPGLAEQCAAINALSGGRALGAETDVRDYAQAVRARDLAVDTFGSVDFLINCAGGYERRMLNRQEDFIHMPISVYDWGLDVNLKGPFYFCHTVMQQMAKQMSGVIINIGSVSGEEGDPDGPAYPTAKSGIMYGLTRSLARCGARYHVRVCCVSPGPVLTRPGMASMKTLLGRAGEPQELVDFILYLCSDKGAFFTGSNLVVDGGRLAMGRP